MRLVYFFCGGVKLNADRKDAEKILNLCLHYNFVYRNMQIDENNFSLECSMYTSELIRHACFERKINISVSEKYGIPDILMRYKKRVGVLAGLILATVLVFWSEMYIWDIRVAGCEDINEIAVINQLSEQDFRIGTYIPDVDIDLIENRVLINSADIAWVSINIKGCVAYIEIREKTLVPPEKSKKPANLVAAWDGQIVSIEATAGNVAVKVGDHVRRGDLLVSGIFDSQVWGYRYTRASGEVFAQTVRQIHVEIPLTYLEKCYNGEEETRSTLIIFSKEIKLYRKTGFPIGTYDTISNIEDVCLFDGTRLPLSYMTTTYMWYSYETKQRDADEAIELAYDELNRQIEEFTSSGASLLRKSINWKLTDEAYVLDCNLTMIENIAKTSEFEVVE